MITQVRSGTIEASLCRLFCPYERMIGLFDGEARVPSQGRWGDADRPGWLNEGAHGNCEIQVLHIGTKEISFVAARPNEWSILIAAQSFTEFLRLILVSISRAMG
jgi:hypothetical protein